jgi:hypothetical protein
MRARRGSTVLFNAVERKTTGAIAGTGTISTGTYSESDAGRVGGAQLVKLSAVGSLTASDSVPAAEGSCHLSRARASSIDYPFTPSCRFELRDNFFAHSGSRMAAMLPSSSTANAPPYDNDAVERDLIDPDDGKLATR